MLTNSLKHIFRGVTFGFALMTNGFCMAPDIYVVDNDELLRTVFNCEVLRNGRACDVCLGSFDDLRFCAVAQGKKPTESVLILFMSPINRELRGHGYEKYKRIYIKATTDFQQQLSHLLQSDLERAFGGSDGWVFLPESKCLDESYLGGFTLVSRPSSQHYSLTSAERSYLD